MCLRESGKSLAAPMRLHRFLSLSHPQCFNYKLKQSLLSEQRGTASQIFIQPRQGAAEKDDDDDAPRILIKSWPVIKFDEKSCECNLSFWVVLLGWEKFVCSFCVGAKGRRSFIFPFLNKLSENLFCTRAALETFSAGLWLNCGKSRRHNWTIYEIFIRSGARCFQVIHWALKLN